MSATVIKRNQKPIAVKNLGYLLRNWQGLEYIGFNYYPQNMVDGQLVAHWQDGKTYLTDYASISVCWNFLNRPIFKGLKFNLVLGQSFGRSKAFEIGSPEWIRINGLEYKEQLAEILK